MHNDIKDIEVINRHLAEREAYDEQREQEAELQDLRDEVDALVAKLAEVTAERDEHAERIDELQHACEVVSSEFEGELWQSCRRLLKKTGFDFHAADVDGVQAAEFESHMNETLTAFDCEVVRAEAAEAMLPRAYRAGVEAGAQGLEPKNPVEDWTAFAKQHHADAISIRALTTPTIEQLKEMMKDAGCE